MSKKAPSILRLNNFKHKEDSKPGFYIKTFSEHKKEHPFVMEPHAHDFYLITLFTKGTGIHTIDFTSYEVKKGSVFFMSPAEVHSWNLSDDTDGYVLFFNSSFYVMDAQPKHLYRLPFFRIKERLHHGELNKAQLQNIEIIIQLLMTESRVSSPFQTNILRSALDVLLYKLSSLLENETNSITHPVSLIPQLETLIDQHFKMHLPISFYAEKLHTTTQQLNKLSKSYLGKTVTDLLRERLIAEAKRLLVYSHLSVSEIAYELNFSDNSYFNRFFKRSEKLTPEQFRRRFI